MRSWRPSPGDCGPEPNDQADGEIDDAEHAGDDGYGPDRQEAIDFGTAGIGRVVQNGNYVPDGVPGRVGPGSRVNGLSDALRIDKSKNRAECGAIFSLCLHKLDDRAGCATGGSNEVEFIEERDERG